MAVDMETMFMTWTPPSRIAIAAGAGASEGCGCPTVTVAGGGR